MSGRGKKGDARRRSKWRLKAASLPADFRKALPNFRDPPTRRSRGVVLLEALAGVSTPPDVRRFDWRDRNAVPAARSQGGGYTCTSFAIAAVIESLHYIKNKTRIVLAPGFIHTCLLGRPFDTGATPTEAVDAVAAHGIALGFPGDYPYQPAHCRAQNLYAIRRRVWLPDINAALHAIAAEGPVFGDMFVSPSFFKLRKGDVYQLPAGEPKRLHSVAVVGFDQDARCWIVLNSVGEGWADRGVGRVAFGAGGLLTSRGGYQIFI